MSDHRVIGSPLIDELGRARVFAILRTKASAEITLRAARAIASAGVRFVEVTLTCPDALAVIAALAKEGGAHVGAGTVLAPADVEAATDAGARFLVSPTFSAAVVARAHERGVPILCGAATATEILTAHAAGADLIKVFPASCLGGPAYLRALLAPLEGLRLVPTGGVRLEEVADYLHAGAFAVGVGLPDLDPALDSATLGVRAAALAASGPADVTPRHV